MSNRDFNGHEILISMLLALFGSLARSASNCMEKKNFSG